MNDILIDLNLEYDDEKKETLPMTPISPVVGGVMPAGFPYREELELVKDAGRLFDFSKTKLNPVQQMCIIGYAAKGTKKGACEFCSIDIGTLNKWLKNDEFSEALQEAVDIVRDTLEEELLTRAMDGSDRLLLEAVKAAKPDKYNKKMSDVNVSGTMVHTWADLAKQAIGADITIEVEDDNDENNG